MKTSVKLAIVVAAILIAVAALIVLRPGQQETPTTSGQERTGTVSVGGKNFTEQVILGHMLADLIEARTNLAVDRSINLGGTMICFNALKGGELDLYAEYTGTGLVNILDRPAMRDPDETYQTVKQAFADQWGLVWLKPFGFNNTYTLTMRKDHAEQLGIESIGDLAEYLRTNPNADFQAAFDGEFYARPDGYKGLVKHYDFDFPNKPKQMDAGLMYRACAEGQADVICAFATDGRIAAYDLKVLEDDQNFFPPYYAAPLVRRDALDAHPELLNALNSLAGRLSDDTMRELNYRVDEEGVKARKVARDFLVSEGLIAADDEQ